MKVLMFGWEFPPHISGGLGTACYGISNALSANSDVDLTFVVPKTWGDESVNKMKLIGANEINLIKSKIKTERFKSHFTYISIQSGLVPYIDPEKFKSESKKLEQSEDPLKTESLKSIKFSGKYNRDLMTEIHNFSVVAEHIAREGEFDIIHAHDWLTFPAGILAKKVTGKPLVIHVHATDFDRTGGKVNPDVYKIEKAGMDAADKIITVSDHTGGIVSEKYFVDSSKIITVHNGIEPFGNIGNINHFQSKKKKVVTFLGRITIQKGPKFFVEVARKILLYQKNVEFVMAGSGDMMQSMIDLVKQYKITNKFHFPGFLKGNRITDLLKQSDVFIMPSVSEPFGLVPLEAMHCRVPVIISKQSGVSEVINHAIKIDFWDTDAMADAVYSILYRPALKKMLQKKGESEVRRIRWDSSASKIIQVYSQIIRA